MSTTLLRDAFRRARAQADPHACTAVTVAGPALLACTAPGVRQCARCRLWLCDAHTRGQSCADCPEVPHG